MKTILFFSPSINFRRWLPLVREFSNTYNVEYHSPKAFWKRRQKSDIGAYLDAATSRHGALEFPFERELERLIDQAAPDIIHVFGEPAYPLTYQSAKAANGAVMSCKFSQNIVQKWASYFAIREQYVLERANVIHSPTALSKSVALQKSPSANVEIVPWGAAELFRPGPKGSPRDTILFVGKMIARKGWRTLMDAIEKTSLPADTNVVFVGDGPDLPMLEAAIASSRHRSRIIVKRKLAHEDLCRQYQRARVLVMPSKHSDGSDWGHGRHFKFMRVKWDEQFGMVAAEAMLTATPVIHSDNGSLPEVVGMPELKFRQGDAESLAERLSQTLNMPAEDYDRLCDKTLQIAQRYRWSEVAALMDSHWRKNG